MNIKNEKKGELKAGYQLVVSSEKRILLDYETAPKPPYVQMMKNLNGKQILTFFNPHKYAIYFYDYETAAYTGKIEYEKQGPNAILALDGYYIKNMDSIYVYSRSLVEVVLTDSTGRVKQRISLCNNRSNREWFRYYPQYIPATDNPLIEYQGKLIMTGLSPFSIADSLIRKFHFTACIDLISSNVEFTHTYPRELYGSDANWQDPFFMQPYPELSPTGELLYSFPISHDVYITQRDAEDYRTVYAGSNAARTIHSINDGSEKTPKEVILAHILQQDLYGAIRHDPYRKVYYRFMSQGIPDASVKTRLEEKPVTVIMMDEQFNYMGETVIGTGEEWNWKNSVVTSEGLVMEYIDPNVDSGEEYLILKTFTIEKISQ
ncbi:MAG: DUF4221 domain-containing protein [Tannerella sp.]|nr:DUF4221 domain-containing protein [Tannerella sp.]